MPLAAPGAELVPGAVDGGPAWLLGVYGDGLGVGGRAYLALLAGAFACYLTVVACAPALPVRLLAAAIVVLVFAFALAPPLLSQDVFSYIAYSRLEADHGLNPYESAPDAFPADPVFAHVGWKDTVSAYGPLFTAASYPLGLLGLPVALWTLKALGAAAVLLLALLCTRLAALRGADPTRAGALVGLNPLVLAHVVGGAHNDSLMMLAAVASVGAALAGLLAAGGAGLVAAAAVKASGAFVAPFAALGARPRRRLLVGFLVAAALAAALALAAFGTEVLEAVGLAGENQAATSRYSVPSTLSRLLGVDIDPVRAVALSLFAVAVAGLLVAVIRGMDWVRASGWAALALLLTSGWLLPWYLIWVLPLAAISRDRALVAATLALTAFQLVNRIPT